MQLKRKLVKNLTFGKLRPKDLLMLFIFFALMHIFNPILSSPFVKYELHMKSKVVELNQYKINEGDYHESLSCSSNSKER
jgi:hypothetical protein